MFSYIARFFSAVARLFQTQADTLRGVEAIAANLKTLHAEVADSRDKMRQLLGAWNNSSSTVFFNDDASAWASFCGERYTARNATFAQEVSWIPIAGGGGHGRLRTNAARVKVWALRLSPEGPCALDLIFMVGAHTLRRDSSARLSAFAIDNIIRFIFLIRAVQKYYPQADLSKITVHLVAAPRSHQSVFVAQRVGLRGLEEIGITYSDARDPIYRGVMALDPRPLIVTSDQKIVGEWAKQNDDLRAAAVRQVSFADLEKEFGALVPRDETDTITDLQIRDWAVQSGRPVDGLAVTLDDGSHDVNTYDGHFDVKPRNLSPAQLEMLSQLSAKSLQGRTPDGDGDKPVKKASSD